MKTLTRRSAWPLFQTPMTAILSLLLAGGCGGGGSVSSGGIGGSGFVSGPIEEFGSIVVEGIRFDVDNATITVDGELATASQLELGMIVGISGTLDTTNQIGTAEAVEFEEDLRGPVESIDRDNKELQVMGTTIRTDENTVLNTIDFATLPLGVTVRVSGFPQDEDSLLASRIDLRPGGEPSRIRGLLRALDLDSNTFRLGAVLVNFGSAQILPNSQLQDGALIAVRGTLGAQQRRLTANQVRILDPAGTAAEDAEIIATDLVRQPLANGRFQLGTNRTVIVTQDTVFDGGNSADLIARSRVRVFGEVVNDRTTIRSRRIVILRNAR